MRDAPETPLPVGTHVRHHDQQWSQARRGTAEIITVRGPWPDGAYEYEVLAGRDFSRPLSEHNPMTRRTWWPSHATVPVTEATW